MSEQECIEWMEYLGNMKLAYDRNPNKRKTACDMAIKAFEEIQQYRALGTVEELRVAKGVYDKMYNTAKEMFKDDENRQREFREKLSKSFSRK